VPRLCEVYPYICLTTEEKARKNLWKKHGKTSGKSKKNPQEKARKILIMPAGGRWDLNRRLKG
jgi:hypothetical protein